MSNRTEDLANQARARADAEERARSGSVAGNSDAAERPRALKAEQERKAGERAGGAFDADTLRDQDLSTVDRLAREPGVKTMDEVEESRETTVEVSTVSDATPAPVAAPAATPPVATPAAPAAKPATTPASTPAKG